MAGVMSSESHDLCLRCSPSLSIILSIRQRRAPQSLTPLYSFFSFFLPRGVKSFYSGINKKLLVPVLLSFSPCFFLLSLSRRKTNVFFFCGSLPKRKNQHVLFKPDFDLIFQLELLLFFFWLLLLLYRFNGTNAWSKERRGNVLNQTWKEEKRGHLFGACEIPSLER